MSQKKYRRKIKTAMDLSSSHQAAMRREIKIGFKIEVENV
jgi:hypothetical protein